MLFNIWARTILFLSSYAPLCLIYVILYFGKDNLISIVSLAIALGSVVIAYWLLRQAKSDLSSNTRTLTEVRQDGSQVMSYVASYLIPFLGVSLLDPRQVLALLVYVVILGYLYTTTSMIHVNPTLQVLFGYRVYEVKFETGLTTRLISLRDLSIGDITAVIRIDQSLMIEKAKK